MYDKLSVLIDVLAEEAEVEKSATVCADSDKADGKPFVPQIDHIAKCKLELATKAKNLQIKNLFLQRTCCPQGLFGRRILRGKREEVCKRRGCTGACKAKN